MSNTPNKFVSERNSLIFAHHQSGCKAPEISRHLDLAYHTVKKVCTDFDNELKAKGLFIPRVFVRDSLNNILTCVELSNIIGKPGSQISKWITKYSLTTLKQIVDRKNVYSGVTGTMIVLSDKDGNLYSCKQAAKILRFTISKIRYEYNINGCDTLEKFTERMKDKKANRTILKTYQTPFGDLNVHDILDRHPDEINITTKTIYGRLSRRGGMCPSLWWDKMGCKEFADKLIAEGLVPSASVISLKPKKKPFNRSKACYRKKHTERCINYFLLTESFIGKKRDKPEICQVACGEECKNYEGQSIDTFKFDKHGTSTTRQSTYCRGDIAKNYVRV